MSTKGVTPASAHIAEIAAWRAERLTLAEIGHRLGVTRQRIQQICEQNGIERGAPEQRWPIPRFATRIKLWLWSAGYRRCTCGTWSEKVTKSMTRCPECSRAQKAADYATEKGRERHRAYMKAHPEVIARADAKYRQKMRSTPEGRERLKQRAKRYYERITSTEEGRKKLLESARDRHSRRKTKGGAA